MSSQVVLGYDQSPISDLALEWAVGAAVERGEPLRVVVCWQVPAMFVGTSVGVGVAPESVTGMEAEAAGVLAEAQAKASGMALDLEVHGEIVVGSPAATLVEQSRQASLVVVGSHGRGGFSGLLLGSVSREVATHASCPVAVVREPATPGAKEIVVGVDGSDHALRALDFAFDYASRKFLRVRVLHAWEVPPLAALSSSPELTAHQLLHDLKAAEARATAEVVAGHSDRYPDVDVVEEIVHGSTIGQLVTASETAAAVVVGSRGRGGFLGLLLGSTSHGVVHYAKCPVVVVH